MEERNNMFYIVFRNTKEGNIFYAPIESLEGVYNLHEREPDVEVLSIHDNEERAKEAQREAVLERYH